MKGRPKSRGCLRGCCGAVVAARLLRRGCCGAVVAARLLRRGCCGAVTPRPTEKWYTYLRLLSGNVAREEVAIALLRRTPFSPTWVVAFKVILAAVGCGAVVAARLLRRGCSGIRPPYSSTMRCGEVGRPRGDVLGCGAVRTWTVRLERTPATGSVSRRVNLSSCGAVVRCSLRRGCCRKKLWEAVAGAVVWRGCSFKKGVKLGGGFRIGRYQGQTRFAHVEAAQLSPYFTRLTRRTAPCCGAGVRRRLLNPIICLAPMRWAATLVAARLLWRGCGAVVVARLLSARLLWRGCCGAVVSEAPVS